MRSRIFFYTLLFSGMGLSAVFADEATHQWVNAAIPIWSSIPFVGMLLSIAIVPLLGPAWWERNMLWAAMGWSVVFIIPFAGTYGLNEAVYRLMESVLIDYIPFMVLLLGLFVTAGGIALKGTLAGTTKMNIVLMLVGTILANLVGTTGAAMLMIRPLIRANSWRKYKVHIIVFFIFLVANIGGCLTPLGDPPLFMGFQRGVPFTWTLQLFPLLLFNMTILFIVFGLIDRYYFLKEMKEGRSPQDETGEVMRNPFQIRGACNLVFIAMIIVGVLCNGVLPELFPFFADGAGIRVYDDLVLSWAMMVEISIILLATGLSLRLTPPESHQLNEFTFEPIKEVAQLFIGIFITMIPALIFLKAHGAGLGLNASWQMFWASGMLSSFLDNTPTYLVFLQTAGTLGAANGITTAVGIVSDKILLAISAGSVFMGANTYIGNAPNFMVKSIAEKYNIRMPGFFGYMGWSCAILIPLFIMDMIVFFC